MGIKATYSIAYPDFKDGQRNPGRYVSHRSMGRPTSEVEHHAREQLDIVDDWPTRRRRLRPSIKRAATVSNRRAGKQLCRQAIDGGFDGAELMDALMS